MALRRFAVNFGTGKAGLTTVGYQLMLADQIEVGPRITDVDIYADGNYAFTANLPTNFQGDVVVDTGEKVRPAVLVISCNPNFLDKKTAQTLVVRG